MSKFVVIGFFAIVTLAVSLLFQPWSELGFCLNPQDITTVSILSGPMHALSGLYSTIGLDQLGTKLKNDTVAKLAEEAEENGAKADPDWQKPVVSGDLAYVGFMAVALVSAALAIMWIGVEDAEEKTVLPVKK